MTGSHQFRNQAKLHQVLRLQLGQQLAGFILFRPFLLGAKAHEPAAQAGGDDGLQPVKGAAADEEDVGGINGDVLLLGVLAPALGGTWAMVPSSIFSSACCTPSRRHPG